MPTSVSPSRSIRFRSLAVIGALALGLGLVPAGAAFAAPGDPGTIGGVVTATGSGAPVFGASVFLSVGEGTTDSFGSTSFDGSYALSDIAFGTYWMSVTAPGYVTWGESVTLTEQAQHLVVDTVLSPFSGIGSVSGVVTDAITGAPIEGAVLSIVTEGYFGGNATTDASGVYSFTGLPFGDYQVYVWGSGYQSHDAVLVSLAPDVPSAIVDIALDPYDSGVATLAGSITEQGTGALIQDAQISLSGIDVGYASFTWTNEGAYSVDSLAGGNYAYVVVATGYILAYGTITVDGQGTTTLDVEMVPANSTIAGRVTDGAGSPVEGVSVSTREGNSGFTDANGEYEIQWLAAGAHTVVVGGPYTSWEKQTVDVTTSANETYVQDFQIEPRTTGSIGGVILGPEYSLEKICVTAIDPTTGDAVGATNLSDENATFIVDELAPGTYTLHFKDCDPARSPQFASEYLGDTTVLGEAQTMTIGASDDLAINFVYLDPVTSGSITIAVTDSASGAPIAGATATYTDAGGAHPVVDGDGDGVIALADLPFGDYVVTVTAPGYLSSVLAPITIDSGDPDAEAAARLVGVTVDDGDGHDHGQGHEQHGRGHGFGHDKH